MANNKTRTKKKATKLKKQISENRFNEEKIWLNVVIEYVIDLLKIYIYLMKGLFLLLFFLSISFTCICLCDKKNFFPLFADVTSVNMKINK